ncbi:FKBP-type peptidyl-prolyl cis-trans isomerase [Sphingomonas bacterium]|uniref:FKBP-type peptidyl-prolyl cis-trans isomerase n=1 Tax=Sphingomonas bacterium TaxID=1895847 RepID=UPI0015761682|nr:FKBP-type peptidyl-prolyl cis-trans isomerase [Sphingomonas bacterium]
MSNVTAVPLLPVKRGYLIWLWIGIAAAVLGAAALAWAGQPSTIKLDTLVAGKGPHPTDSDVALINYVGRLTNGTVFDQSQQPTPMPVAGVVPGFSQGLKLMAKGGKYRLTIPPEFAYGPKAAGPIPANSTLVFDVELLDFIPAETLRQLQAQQQMMRGGGGGRPGGPGAMPGQVPPGP